MFCVVCSYAICCSCVFYMPMYAQGNRKLHSTTRSGISMSNSQWNVLLDILSRMQQSQILSPSIWKGYHTKMCWIVQQHMHRCACTQDVEHPETLCAIWIAWLIVWIVVWCGCWKKVALSCFAGHRFPGTMSIRRKPNLPHSIIWKLSFVGNTQNFSHCWGF